MTKEELCLNEWRGVHPDLRDQWAIYEYDPVLRKNVLVGIANRYPNGLDVITFDDDLRADEYSDTFNATYPNRRVLAKVFRLTDPIERDMLRRLTTKHL